MLARRGSSGFPGKNYRLLLGIPCFIWSIIAAQNSQYVDLIVTSSCCPFVKESWEKYHNSFPCEKLKYIDRPEELNSPNTKNEDVLLNVLEQYSDFDWIVTLQPTSPIRNNNLLDKCLEYLFSMDADSLLTATRHTPFIWKKRKYPLFHDYVECPNNYYLNRPMRQEIEEQDFIFLDNGNIYITKKDILLKNKNRLGGKIAIYEIDKFQSLQVDDEQDFELIETICKNRGQVL